MLALYKGPIRGSRSTEWLDVVDAAAVLWRLSLFGVDVGEHAEQLAADIDPLVGEPVYLFNDWHAVMVFGLAGRHEDIERVLSGNRRRAVGTNRAVAERAGLSLLEGFGSFAAGRFDRAIDLMMEVRPFAQAVGGVRRERDIIDLTLLAAAARNGEKSMVRALLAERVARKPSSLAAARALLAANGGSV